MSGARIPKRWTEAEDKILLDEVTSQSWSGSGQVKDWTRVAAKLPGRTNKDCRKRWVNKVCGNLKKGAWDDDEDRRLRDAVDEYGQRWTLVASMVGSRSSDQCAKRWQHRLDPRLEHEDWTPDEDELLLEDVQSYGREWKFIQEQDFPARSPNDLKNRFVTLTRRLPKSHASVNSTNGISVTSDSSESGLAYDFLPVDSTLHETVNPEDHPPDCTSWLAAHQDPTDHDQGWLSHMGLPTSPAPPADGSELTIGVGASTSSISWLESTGFFTNTATGSSSSVRSSGDNTVIESATNAQHQLSQATWAGTLPHHQDGETEHGVLLQQQPQLDDCQLVGRVSLVVEHCDRETLGRLLKIHRSLKGRGKLHIEHDER
ncbi:hypothetical protein B0J18DRAFT_418744 [Chaetomium sp. MPI-SDFR-AT-0129]|nr:hypothetical protein B0J18DRAFT_418744 [Chaetomium sp. MPI-SDFR-AT-0129]